jgi:hypothetical protein
MNISYWRWLSAFAAISASAANVSANSGFETGSLAPWISSKNVAEAAPDQFLTRTPALARGSAEAAASPQVRRDTGGRYQRSVFLDAPS